MSACIFYFSLHELVVHAYTILMLLPNTYLKIRSTFNFLDVKDHFHSVVPANVKLR